MSKKKEKPKDIVAEINNEGNVFGLKQNTAAVVAYLFFFFTGAVIYFGEKKNKFIKFHAMQAIVMSILFFVGLFIMNQIIDPTTIAGYTISNFYGLAYLGLWLLLSVKAFQNKIYKLPIIGSPIYNKFYKLDKNDNKEVI